MSVYAIKGKGIFVDRKTLESAYMPSDVCMEFESLDDANFWMNGEKAPEPPKGLLAKITASIKSIFVKPPIRKAPKPFVPIHFTDDQKNALAIMQGKGHVFLTGGAGTGKSFLLRFFISKCDKAKTLIAAPTGIAAININGVTLSSLFQFPPTILTKGTWTPNDLPDDKKKMLAAAQTLIIDEISMCRIDMFECIATILKKYSNLRCIFCGDFAQLPPIVDRASQKVWQQLFGDKIYAFQSSEWQALGITVCQLKEIVRQKDCAFSSALNKLRLGNSQGLDYINQHSSDTSCFDAITLCGTNKQADEKNKIKYDELLNQTHATPVTFYLKKEGIVHNGDIVCPTSLTLIPDVRVMFLTNAGNFYQNGSFGTVTGFDFTNSHTIGVKVKTDTGNDVTVFPKTWELYGYTFNEVTQTITKAVIGQYKQIPLRLGYAVTIHKSQGQTYSAANIDFVKAFADGQLYVALSRVTQVSALHIQNRPLPDSLLTCSKIVRDFYVNLPSYNTESLQPLDNISP